MQSKDVPLARGAGMSRQEREIMDLFAADRRATVRAGDVVSALSVERANAQRMLSRLAAKGWLLRLRKGTYSLVPLGAPAPEASIEDPWPLAMALFSPCYLSGWTAAEHWDLTDQIFNATVIVTAKPQRSQQQTVAGLRFVCRTVEARALFGTTRVRSSSGARVLMADPHRLVVDLLTAPALGGDGRHALDIVRAYLRSKHRDLDKLLEYAERLGKGVVFKRLGFAVEQLTTPPAEWITRCSRGMSAGISLLDPAGPKRGRIVSRWRLRVNLPIELWKLGSEARVRSTALRARAAVDEVV
jgi:predicted transcriptional regulator of viral defense system